MNQQNTHDLPVAVIGAGPIGLAAAANLVERGLTPLIFEAGAQVASSMRDWGHVKLFTPWSYLVDPAGVRLLQAQGSWEAPPESSVPLAKEVVERYLDPLASLPKIAAHLKLSHRITSVSRDGHDLMKDGNRQTSPFLLVADTPHGTVRFKARAVIDASGTWTTPNPMGAGGVWADGERLQAGKIRYGIPDLLGRERDRYKGKRTLVVGSGHSAIGSVLSLVQLAAQQEGTQVSWAVRRQDPRKLWGGGNADELSERGALGTRVHQAVHSGAVTLLTGLSIAAVTEHPTGHQIIDVNGAAQATVDEIIVATGSRPDLEMLRELRLELDPVTEASKALGPLIDPNHHSCGSVPPHGAKELKHPERDFYTIGMKSYGRAPTFLLRTGYEQARSVVAELAGDHEGAQRVELTLPQTGVCSTDLAYGEKQRATSCC